MNRLFLIMLIAITSCSARQTEAVNIRESINGIWVREDYINSLKITKSPSRSSEFLVGEVSLNIASSGQIKDTLYIGVSFNNHEGGDYRVSLRSFSSNRAWLYTTEQVKSNREIEFQMTDKDTVLFVTKYSKTGKVVTKVKYVRVLNNPSLAKGDMGFGVDYITNMVIFEGIYSLFDSQNKLISRGITLDSYGNIKGWADFSAYQVLNDFTMCEEDDMDDAIFLLRSKDVKEKQGFSFRIENNAILIEGNKNGKRQLVYKLLEDK